MSTENVQDSRPTSEGDEHPPKRVRLSPKTAHEEPPSDAESELKDDDTDSTGEHDDSTHPRPHEQIPPLPTESVPARQKDDGWDPVWDDQAKAYYFYNRFTSVSQWENPRVPEASPSAPGIGNHDRIASNGPDATPAASRPAGGYDPSIHGDYDPTAPYAQGSRAADPQVAVNPEDPNIIYTATGAFNRFTGKWQGAAVTPENFNDENKSRRQMNAFFDVDAAANSHDGKSLKAERSGKKLSKKEVKAFKDKRREKKEEKRRAWLRD